MPRGKRLKRYLVIGGSIILGVLFIVLSLKNFWPKISDLLLSIGVELLAGLGLYFLLDRELEKILSKNGNSLKMKIPGDINLLINEIRHNKRIRILTTFFSFIEDDTKKHDFKTTVIKSIEDKKANVEILILDPISYALIQRQENMKSLSDNERPYSAIKKTLRTLRYLNDIGSSILAPDKQKFQVKVFNQLPPFLLYQVHKSFNMNFYAKDEIAADDEFWRFSDSSEFSDFLTFYFDRIWKEKKEVNKSVCSLQDYFFITIEKNAPMAFIDFFNVDNGIFFENRVLGYSANFSIPSTGEISYRGNNNFVYKKVQIRFENKNISVTISGDSIEIDIKDNDLEAYLRDLWLLKYIISDNESKHEFKLPNSFAFIQIQEKNIS